MTGAQREGLRERFAALLASRRVIGVAVLLGVALCAPALGNGVQTEDRAQRVAASWAPWESTLYSAGGADMWTNYYFKDAGVLPWIAVEDLHVAFYRPLGALSLHVDYRFWPDHPALMYAHGLAWLALLIGAAAWLYRGILRPEWVAGLAALLYAVDDAHGPAIGWLAARHSVLSSAFGVLALALHDRWRRHGLRSGALLAPLALLVSLFSGELGVGALAYLFAHVLFLDPAPWRVRFRAVVGWASVFGFWFIAYSRSGAGAFGSGTYVHPRDEPLVFLEALWQRLPVLIAGAVGAPWADTWFFVPVEYRTLLVVAAAVVTTMILLILSPIVRRSAEGRFWLCGVLLSAIPACTAPPTDRILLFPALGGMALAAMLTGAVLARLEPAPRARLWRLSAAALCGFLLLVHGVLAPLILPLRVAGLRRYDDAIVRAADQIYERQGPYEQHIVILNASDYYTGVMLAGLGAFRHPPGAQHVRVLYGGAEPLTVRRPNAQTLELSAPSGFNSNEFNRVYRGPAHRMTIGQGLQLSSLLIIVRALDDRGMPSTVEFRFARPLEHSRFRFVAFERGRYGAFTPPAVGESRVIAPFNPSSFRGDAPVALPPPPLQK